MVWVEIGCSKGGLDEYLVVVELCEDGYIDYIVFLMLFLDGLVKVVIFVLKVLGGFFVMYFGIFDLFICLFVLVCEFKILKWIVKIVLDMYVGLCVGFKVLDGIIWCG